MKKSTLIFLALSIVLANSCQQDQTGNKAAEETAAAADTSMSAAGQAMLRSGMSRYASPRAGLRFSYPLRSSIMDEGNLITVKFPPAPDSICTPSWMQIVVEENCTQLAFTETGGASVETADGKEKLQLYEFIKGYGQVNGESAYSFKTMQEGKCFTLTFFGSCPLEKEGALQASFADDIVRTFRVGG